MSEPKVVNCRECNAEIVFVKTRRGKSMPLDVKPEKRFVLFDEPDGIHTHSVDTYVSHFATCTKPERFRKKGG